jgi:hypothetical protein
MINLLKNGYDDGDQSDTLADSWSPGDQVVTAGTGDEGDFTVGQRIVIGGVALAQITAAVDNPVTPPFDTPNGQTLTVTVLAGTGTASSGSGVAASASGYSNLDRESGVGGFGGVLEAQITTDLTNWQTYLTAEQTALNANDDTGAAETAIATALSNISTALGVISTFSSAPATGSNGKFSDTVLNQISSEITTRQSQVTSRLSQIATYLGSVSQDGSGNISGTGAFYNLMNWIVQRISKAGGTLTKYYSFGLITTYTNATTSNTSSQLSGFQQNLTVTALAANPNGSTIIQVNSATGFSVGDTVYIMDDTNLATLQTTIEYISGNNVTLLANVSGFATNKNGRMVKVL